jgi:hypothetical protein
MFFKAKKPVISMLLFSLVFSEQMAFAATVPPTIDPTCSVKLEEIIKNAKAKIIAFKDERDLAQGDKDALDQIDLKIKEELPKIKDDLGIALADDAGERIAKDYEDQMDSLNKKIDDFRGCGNNLSCLKVRGQKILLWTDKARESIRAGIKAEGEAKEMLVSAAESMATEMVSIQKFEEAAEDKNIGQPIKDEYLQKVEDAFNKTPPAAQNYFLKLGMIYWDNIKALFSKSLISNPARLLNFGKDITTILTIQQASKWVFTKIGWLAKGEPFKNSAWVIPNTIVMVYLGWVKGGEATAEMDRPFTLNAGDPFRALPALMYGANGFKTELRQRFSSLVTLFFAELPIMYLVRTVTDSILHVSSSTHGLTNAAILFGQTAVFLAGFHLYLAARGSLFDKPFFLNILPNLKKGTRNSFEVGLYNALRENGGLDDQLSLSEFRERLAPSYITKKKDREAAELKLYEKSNQVIPFSVFSAGLNEDYQIYKSYYTHVDTLENNFSPALADLDRQRTVLIPAGEWPIRLFNESTGSLLLFAWLQAVNAVFAHFLR